MGRTADLRQNSLYVGSEHQAQDGRECLYPRDSGTRTDAQGSVERRLIQVMNCLLTRATGFLGRRLVDRLLTTGHSVNYLARQRSSRLDSRAAFHSWDRKEEPRLESVPRLDAVFHLAGEPVAQRWTPEVKKRIQESRV